MRLLVLFLGLLPVSLGIAQSQNSEMGFHYVLTPQNVETEPGVYRTRFQPGYSIRFAHQFFESDRGRLYWELTQPIAVLDNFALLSDRTRPDALRSAFHLGGIRYQRYIHRRVALYAGIAGGVSFQRFNRLIGDGDTAARISDSRITPALALSAGTGFRVHRRLSLQFIVTNMVAPRPYPEARRNNLLFQPGIAIHF